MASSATSDTESRLMTIPTIAVKGLVARNPYPELEDTSYIYSSSGHLAMIKFEGKKVPRLGRKNGVTPVITDITDSGKVVFKIKRHWNYRLKVKDK